jgi:hypothetical protein
MKRILRVAVGIGAVAALCAALTGGGYYAMTAKFNPDPPVAHYPRPATALEAQQQDIDYFRKLIALDRSFPPAARDEAERRIAALQRLGYVLPHPKFRVALMEIVALADNGHTRLNSNPGADPLELPVRVRSFPDGVYILHARNDYRDLLGARVIAVDGRPIESVIARLKQLRGGTAAFRRLNANVYLIYQDVLYGAGIAAHTDRVDWTIRLASGQTVTRTLFSYLPKADEISPPANRWLSPDPAKGMKDWAALRPREIPLTLQRFDSAFQRHSIPDSCTLLVQLKSNVDVDSQHIADFLRDTETAMRARPPCNVIFDMRFNGGGDYTNTASFARRLPGLVKPGGHIYLLTSTATFSAAITTTAFVKEAGGDRVTILGESVGDRLAFFSEGNRGCLPNYHLCVSYQTGKHDYAHPCWNPDVCYWLNWFYPVRVKTLQPDETITMTFVDWKAGRDRVFERALALAAGQRK